MQPQESRLPLGPIDWRDAVKEPPLLIGGLLLLALLVAMLTLRDLPMVDLPQHQAILAHWIYGSKRAFHGENFVLNFRTPYWLSYLVTAGLAKGMGIPLAFKVTLWLSVAGFFASLVYLCERLGHTPWIAVLGLPIALSYNFLYGFTSYVFAMPFVLGCLGMALGHRERATGRSAIRLTLGLLLLLASHGFAFAQTVLCVTPLLTRGSRSWLVRLAPVAVALVVAYLWLALGVERAQIGADIWAPSLARLRSLPGLLISSGASDGLGTTLGVILGALLAVCLGPLQSKLELALPLVACTVGYLTFPAMVNGYGPLWPRFAWLLFPTALIACCPSSEKRLGLVLTRRWTTAAFALGTVGIFILRMHTFNREVAPLHAVVESMPSDRRVRPIVFSPESLAFPGLPALNHLPALYVLSRGGMMGYGFAMYPSSPIRYHSSFVPLMGGGLEWVPNAFQFERESPDYDCFLVHSATDRRRRLFGENQADIELLSHQGDWWSYCKSPTYRIPEEREPQHPTASRPSPQSPHPFARSSRHLAGLPG